MFLDNFKRYIATVLEIMNSYLDTEPETLTFAFEKYKGKKYCKAIELIGKTGGQKHTLYIHLNDDIKYCDYRDIVLCQAVDTICMVIKKRFTPNNDDNWFYDFNYRRFLTAKEFAHEVYEELQRIILRRYAAINKINFSEVSMISELLYESESLEGSVAFLINENHEYDVSLDNNTIIRFKQDSPIYFLGENKKYIRKLLAGVGENILLFCYNSDDNNYFCYGYVKKGTLLPCIITFENSQTWKFYFNNKPVFKVKNGKIISLQNKLNILIEELKNEFKNKTFPETLNTIISKISLQKHGTSIIFLDVNQYGDYMSRLVENNRAVLVDSINMEYLAENQDALRDLTRMDGAIVIDINSEQIKYINVIVDGRSLVKGDLGSGARHNTIISFIDNLAYDDKEKGNDTTNVAALIFSESGSVRLVKGSDRRKEVLKTT